MTPATPASPRNRLVSQISPVEQPVGPNRQAMSSGQPAPTNRSYAEAHSAWVLQNAACIRAAVRGEYTEVAMDILMYDDM
eukprot:4704384-Alexandrium_andersonii.AAC.1